MRHRHVPRLCESCQAPMARQSGRCWRCGTQWASEDQPRTRLRMIPGGAPDEPVLASAASELG
jgi:predicted amidophosphoribosyltransferase